MRLAKADKLADAFQDKIVAWRMGGDTVDQILAKLRFEDLAPEALPGRTGMSLFVRKLDRAKEYLLRYRVATATLGRSFEEAAEAKEARLNIELLDGEVTERLFQMIEAGAERAEKLSIKEIHGLAQLVFRLARARRTEVATTIAARKEKRTESERAARAAAAAKKAGATLLPSPSDWEERVG